MGPFGSWTCTKAWHARTHFPAFRRVLKMFLACFSHHAEIACLMLHARQGKASQGKTSQGKTRPGYLSQFQKAEQESGETQIGTRCILILDIMCSFADCGEHIGGMRMHALPPPLTTCIHTCTCIHIHTGVNAHLLSTCQHREGVEHF